ncbi:hypothetical protein OSTOST_02466, partial [Ostertagia ostertagi]
MNPSDPMLFAVQGSYGLSAKAEANAAMADRARRAAPADDGTVRINGIVLPADMSDELKTLNVKLEDTAVE